MRNLFDQLWTDQRLCVDFHAGDHIFHVGLWMILGFEALLNQLGRILESKDGFSVYSITRSQAALLMLCQCRSSPVMPPLGFGQKLDLSVENGDKRVCTSTSVVVCSEMPAVLALFPDLLLLFCHFCLT